MIQRFFVTAFCSAIIISGCSTLGEQEAVTSVGGEIPGSYKVADQKLTFTSRLAAPQTRMEPLPTSYVLFPTPPVSPISPTPTSTELNKYQAEFSKVMELSRTRVKTYCEAHFARFKYETQVIAEDPFSNRLNVFWPVIDRQDSEGLFGPEGLANVQVDCTQLANDYDYSRADAMLGGFEQYSPTPNARGPILVTDFGFDAIVISMDLLDDSDLSDVPSAWVVQMRTAFASVENQTNPLVQSRAQLIANISRLEAKDSLTDDEKSLLKSERKKLKDITKKIFKKDGIGHALACAVGSGLVKIGGAFIPNTSMLDDKLDDWCEN